MSTTSQPSGTHEPAETRSMGVVHSALRRDLKRTRVVLESPPYPDDARRRALADHVEWMMSFLHAHHTAEDTGLWPLIRSRNPAAAELLDQMAADHRRIGPAIDALNEAASAYRTDPGAREQLLGALDDLTDVLLPHLEREELEMMPVVAATIDTATYLEVESKYFVKPKGFVELGREAHFLVDGVDEETRDFMFGLVPPIPRFLLDHGFKRSYRHRSELLWDDGPASRIRPITIQQKKAS
ncbi:hemerythrin domain-containing protein [Gordonia sp. GONU]|uniref:hemerythrin domain-containing protein n=1 Tax=Gordonia TaxID=2053 RepID=UPI0021ABA311|nr:MULTISPECIES: hemerythrin domain-containing protein [Gordonia]MCR8897375.1 hemerythrin domain-containing protein [Gordonia sp. GONU]MCZ0914178.1 hemerythrin domain-containing protein [Gordonia amicalis]